MHTPIFFPRVCVERESDFKIACTDGRMEGKQVNTRLFLLSGPRLAQEDLVFVFGQTCWESAAQERG